MATELVTMDDMSRMAKVIAKSGLFGMKNVEEVGALMLIAQAEGLHPAIAARDYHIIQGRPSLKADAMLARFQQSGGKVKWNQYDNERVEAVFSHPQGGSVTVDWDLAKAENAELFKIKDGKRLQNTRSGWQVGNWQKYPRNMLRARAISEGVRTIYPAVCAGVYTPDETEEFASPPKAPEPKPEPIEINAEIVTDDCQKIEVPPTTKNFDFLKAMAGEKIRLGEVTYYELLGMFNYKKSNEITDKAEQSKVWKSLQKAKTCPECGAGWDYEHNRCSAQCNVGGGEI